jgi:hypothetical protein
MTAATVMNGVIAILVVLLLTGSPASSVACAVACGPSTTATAQCHEHMTDHATAVAVAPDVACGVLLPDVPYVKENVTSSPIVEATATCASVLQSRLAAPHPVSVTPAAAWLDPPLILRL